MKQAEIWYADLNPIKDNEQAGYRPVVIISGNLLNKYKYSVPDLLLEYQPVQSL